MTVRPKVHVQTVDHLTPYSVDPNCKHHALVHDLYCVWQTQAVVESVHTCGAMRTLPIQGYRAPHRIRSVACMVRSWRELLWPSAVPSTRCSVADFAVSWWSNRDNSSVAGYCFIATRTLHWLNGNSLHWEQEGKSLLQKERVFFRLGLNKNCVPKSSWGLSPAGCPDDRSWAGYSIRGRAEKKSAGSETAHLVKNDPSAIVLSAASMGASHCGDTVCTRWRSLPRYRENTMFLLCTNTIFSGPNSEL